ncbi:hypothetical protein HYC85_022941 [Camellia sinensis]|uniref:Fe2OG dioxygenase domain-containing protein n=1 Tax=Camellia sinensis TaxID=4442 RepID=A0A7J7GD46_CAMSI|nr:hypothetical protein HYC85_022941 [Camellia sinensis]
MGVLQAGRPWRAIGDSREHEGSVERDVRPTHGGEAEGGEIGHYATGEAMVEYMEALDKLGMTIMEMLANGLGLQSDFLTKNFEEKDSTMIRINKYPPCPLPEKCLGVGSHTDPHTLTILLADNVGGLQVLRDDNQWVGIRPIPNSFVINIGDTLEVISLFLSLSRHIYNLLSPNLFIALS